VIGSAGGELKCRLLTERFGLDAAFDYRNERARVALPRLAPEGIDVYFDNVGGSQLAAALHAAKVGGRVALCGQISQFDASDDGGDLSHLLQAILKRLTLRGFIVRDHEDLRPEFEYRTARWLRQGDLVSETTVEEGLERAVEAFLGMLRGANVGKMLVRLDGDAKREP
jgi:NADPH-dependent curcumin reductase CurA